MKHIPLVKKLFKLREAPASRPHWVRAKEISAHRRPGTSGWVMEFLLGAGLLRLEPVRQHHSVNETRL